MPTDNNPPTQGVCIKRQVWYISNAFTNSVEVNAQEAVNLVPQIQLTNSTRQEICVDTSMPDKRIQLIKVKKYSR